MGKQAPRSIYDQYSSGPARRRRRIPRWVMVLALAPLTALVAGGVYLGALALATRDAAEQVFVPSVRATYAPAPATAATAPGATAQPGMPPPTAAPVTPTTAPAILPEWQGTDRLNVVLLGVDKRGEEDLSRSDTMILVSIDPTNKRVGMLSIPRDLWVTIPGYGPNKINAAFPLGEQSGKPNGGPALVMQTIEATFKVPVHYFATVDFRGFTKIIDAVGGVTVEVPYALKDDEYPADESSNYTRLYIPAGLQWMDGTTALRYARSRHFDTDFGRQRRQQQVLQAIREQGLKLNLLPQLPRMIGLLAGSVRTDIPVGQIPALVNLGASIDRASIKSYGMTVEMTIPYDTPELFYLEPNWPKINAALREMQGGPATRTDAAVASTPARATTAPRPAATPTTPRLATAPPRPTSTVAPPVRATPTPVPLPRVWVRNGTNVQGLAARQSEVLRARGYPIVDVSQDPNSGQYPRSIIYIYGATDRAQALAVAQALDLPASTVKPGPTPAPAGADILVILGDDMR